VLVTLAAAFGLFLSLGGTASASVGCTFSALTVNIVINSAVPPANNDIVVKRSGQNILVNGSPCSNGFGAVATVINTDQINITPAPAGAVGDDHLTIDLTAGPFSPGFTIEVGPGSLNEIEWFVDLGEGNNGVTVLGSNAAEGVTGGQNLAGTNWDGLPVTAANGQGPFTVPAYGDVLLNLNSGLLTDDDADVWIVTTHGSGFLGAGICGAAPIVPVPRGQQGLVGPTAEDCLLTFLELNLDGGDNVVFLKGGDGTGAALCDLGFSPFTLGGVQFQPVTGLPFYAANPVPVAIITGGGNDTIIGSECSDLIQPGGGNDFVDGNGPDVSQACAFQDDILGVWGFFPFGSSPEDFPFTASFPFLDFIFDPVTGLPIFFQSGCTASGDIIDFEDLPGPATITINEDGSLTITGIPGTFVGVEHVIGTQGNDTLNGNSGSNFLAGGAGDDIINGNGGDDVLEGDDGNDTIAGGLGDDVQIGNAGDDTFDENQPLNADGVPTYGPLGNGADPIDGGDGTDTVLYDKRTNSTVVYLGLISTFNDGADPNHDGLTNEFDDVFFTTENVKTGSGDDLISANFTNNRANNVFTDNAGNDCVEGGPGNDQFIQGTAPQGADVQIGNTGSDLSDYSGRTDAVQVSLDGVSNDGDIATNEGDSVGGFSVSCRPATILVSPPISVVGNFFLEHVTTTVDTPIPGPAPTCFVFDIGLRAQQGDGPFIDCPGEQVGGDNSPLTNVDVENVNGGAGNDILVGSDVGNVLNGNGGNDQISGQASADKLNGGDGDDIINPGSGNDAVNGGAGTNTVDYASAGAGGVGVQVNLTTGTASGDGNDTLASIQNVRGSSFTDGITGDENANVLNGNGGNDQVTGKAGDDTVNGGAGNDQLFGNGGADKMTGANGNDAMQGGAQNDWLQGGNGRDTILGQKGNDKLYGNAQPDFLNGGPGNDLCKPGSPGLARGDVAINCEV
jgi:Ca2+-binding RTX toxin-like protein